MVRSRVLSLISSFGGPKNGHDSSTSSSSTTNGYDSPMGQQPRPQSFAQNFASLPRDSPPPATKTGRERSNSRPMSMIQGHHPPVMEVAQDTLPELQPVFNFLNIHQNKLYQEGFFLKLNDLDAQGRPFADRQWVECFAQLIGTVLSLWDAAALDAAGADGEVAPTFINLGDASIQMIETLPTRNEGMQPLQNVLSISTAAKNRYLLHFNSLHSLTQWTAGIRLAMFEHASLQESYTGSLIAGKGKSLNNIRTIMERSKFKQGDWARVRFGAGTPWRRCWSVISPPDEKEYQKAQKSMKKKSAYGRATPVLKGNIKFYESKKITKKTQPIATITDAYSAYAIYPQSKPLIEMSTLVKVEGQVTTHVPTTSTVEGFVFVMPEVHPAVSGFEMMLRWLFPVFDIFNLYGRPTRLLADTVSTRSLMFALPNGKKYGYLEPLDVANLVHTEGSSSWSEQEWRKRLKDLTSQRMLAAPSAAGSNGESKNYQRASLPTRNGGARFTDSMSGRSSMLMKPEYNRSSDAVFSQNNARGVGPGMASDQSSHARSNSEMSEYAYRNQTGGSYTPSRLSVQPETDADSGPQPPPHGTLQYNGSRPGTGGTTDRSSSGSDYRYTSKGIEAQDIGQGFPSNMPPDPVAMPPAFTHSPREVPHTLPNQSPDLRREKSRMSNATLSQLVDAGKMGGGVAAAGAAAAWNGKGGDHGQRVVIDDNTSKDRATADRKDVYEGITPENPPTSQTQAPPPSKYEFNPASTPTTPRAPSHHPEALPPLTTNINRVSRKPVANQHPSQQQQSPTQQPYEADILSPGTESSIGSLRHNIDEDALDRIVARRPSFSTEKDVRPEDESVYDDDSVDSPDYASSTDTKRSADLPPRPRSGIMKTVGAVADKDEVTIGDIRYSRGKPARPEDPNLPLVDFGPTQSFIPTTRRPSTSDTLTKFGHAKKPSDATIGGNEKRYSAGRQKSPAPGLDGRRESRSPRGDDHRKSVIWQPGMGTGRASPGPRITPEQFVQQRVASNTPSPTPYSHNRVNSSTTTPPQRPASGDWTAHTRQQPSRDLPTRPHSRGSSMMLNQNDFSSHLSAREQEHVARVTGSSFFNLTNNNTNISNNKIQPRPLNSGLVGTIDAREREKQEAKQGVSGQMVQHAIAQRQQHAQMQQPQQMPQPYAAASTYNQPLYNPGNVAGAWNPQQQYQQPQPQPQRQQQWMNGSNQVYQNGNPSFQQVQPQPASPPPGYAHSQYYHQSPQQQQQRPQSQYSHFGGGYPQARR